MEYSIEELNKMDSVEVYKLRLSGKLKKFPNNFFRNDKDINYEVCAKVLRYLIEEILCWNDEEIYKNLSLNTFRDNGLYTMLYKIFNINPYHAINNAYPGRFKQWQLSKVSRGYWNKETAKEATIWLLEEKLGWSDEDICKYLSVKTFKDNGYLSMLILEFDGSPYEALNNAYPGKFKPWELNYVEHNYWNEQTTKEAIKWLVEQKFKWSDVEVCNNISLDIFKDNGLYGMINSVFSGNIYKALENAYPGKFVKVGKKIKLAKNKI